ncbi:hypothetical protein C5S32_09185 [ANME-1 cluster archaeon GoMg1]|nr:hypothetical protein [ANME-1 cluster archaeon GoMg1]
MVDIIGELFKEVKMNTTKDDLVSIIVFGRFVRGEFNK